MTRGHGRRHGIGRGRGGLAPNLLDRNAPEASAAETIAELLKTSPSTLRRWRRECDRGQFEPELPGPKPFRPSRSFLRCVLQCVEEFVLVGTRALFRALPCVPRRWIEWFSALVQERQARNAPRACLEWTLSGAVWSMDHTHLDAAIDGGDRCLLLFLVRDLASGKVLTALGAPLSSAGHPSGAGHPANLTT